MRPLDSALLHGRVDIVTAAAVAAAGPVEEVLFERLLCDGCGLIVDLTAGFPKGWTTDGSPALGWVDWCPACTAGARG